MNAITLLKADHKTVSELFRRFERSGDDAYETKRDIVARIVQELSIHTAIEEQVLYPAIRTEVRGVEDMTLEALEEHHIVKWTLSELEHMDPRDERYDAKVTVLIESVRHHVKEEENDLFPKVSKALSRTRLKELGEAMEKTKKVVPVRPHPRLPDTPPLNAIAGAVAVADRLGGMVIETAKNAIDAANPLSSNDDEEVATKIKRTAKKAGAQAKSVKTNAKTKATKATTAAKTAKTNAKTKATKATTTAKTAKANAKIKATKATKAATSATKSAAHTTAETATKAARSAASTSPSKRTTTRKATTSVRKATTAARTAKRAATNGSRPVKRAAKKATSKARATASR